MTEVWRFPRLRLTATGVALFLGLVACDERALPTQPGTPAPAPQPVRSTGPIAFVSNRDGTDRIYLANADGSNVTPLAVGADPAWSPDGRQLAFHAGRTFSVFVIGVDGAGQRMVTSGKSPGWSPDGRSLVFEDWDEVDISLVAADGSNRRPLFDSGGYGSFGPRWSPDGSRILFSVGTYVDHGLGLWTMNVDGTDARQFGPPDRFWDAWSPAWSPDGSEVAFVSHAGIEVARADGSGRHLRVPGNAYDPDWTPDGWIIYAKGEYPGPIRIFVNDGSSERQLIPDATGSAPLAYRDWQAVWLK